MRPMLDDLELPNVQEITTYDRRALAEHKPPGMAGSLLQNMGRRPTRLVLWGVAAGPEALDFVERLEEKFRSARPVPFTADIIADSQIQELAIDDLQWQELAGKPERFEYVLTLREYIEPVEPAEAEEEALNQATAADAAEDQDAITDQIASRQGTLEVTVETAEPNQDLSRVQIHVQGTTEDGQDYDAVLDELTDGVFRKTDVPTGEYTVTLQMRA